MAEVNVRNVDNLTKQRAIYVCKCKGSDLSTEVRKLVEQIAKDFDKVKGE
jgi:antitoxin component of RelBE/YafQ-DinJ toxin-antitoxin module